MFLEISQNSQENTCARVSFLIKLKALGLRPATLFKKRLCHKCFPVNFCEISKNTFFTENLWTTASTHKNSVKLPFKRLVFKRLLISDAHLRLGRPPPPLPPLPSPYSFTKFFKKFFNSLKKWLLSTKQSSTSEFSCYSS